MAKFPIPTRAAKFIVALLLGNFTLIALSVYFSTPNMLMLGIAVAVPLILALMYINGNYRDTHTDFYIPLAVFLIWRLVVPVVGVLYVVLLLLFIVRYFVR